MQCFVKTVFLNFSCRTLVQFGEVSKEEADTMMHDSMVRFSHLFQSILEKETNHLSLQLFLGHEIPFVSTLSSMFWFSYLLTNIQ